MDLPTKAITELSRSTKIWGEFDVLVLGGGPAGIAAVTAAARLGQQALLMLRNSTLHLL
jgi:alkyl hydroperoxide reductase subunit AhpF